MDRGSRDPVQIRPEPGEILAFLQTLLDDLPTRAYGFDA
jgi:hypothetical protein